MPFEKKKKILYQCAQCGEVLKTYPYKKGKARFCSNECKYLYIKNVMKKKHSLIKRNKIPLKCQNIFCNKTFWVIPSVAHTRKYCCRECWLKTLTADYKEYIIDMKETEEIKDNIKRMIYLNK